MAARGCTTDAMAFWSTLNPSFPVTIRGMRWMWFAAAVLSLTVSAVGADTPSGVTLLPCGAGEPGVQPCTPSPQQIKEAKLAFDNGLKLQHKGQVNEAFQEYEKAARLAPRNVNYVTAREMTRQQLVYDALERGNKALLTGEQVVALAAFRNALALDPKNTFAQQRLNDAIAEWSPKTPAILQVSQAAGELHIQPIALHADIHYRGNSLGLLQQVSQAFGVSTTFDDSVPARDISFDITSVDFQTAMDAACAVTDTFWTPLTTKQVLVAADTPANHLRFDRMAMRTFYMPGITSPTDLTSLVNVLHSVFEIKFVNAQPRTATLTVRAPQDTLDAATQFLESLDDSRPQVMLDVKVFEVSSSLVRQMGMTLPNQFQLFNIPAAAIAALTGLSGSNIQNLINQLISSGGINETNSTALSALLAQLQSQQNSIFSQPVATFGNGSTLMGLSLGTAGIQLSRNESMVKTLEHATLRASQNNETTFRMGSRYPVVNASFAPIFNSSAISQVIANNSYQSAFPSFTFEDLGLSVKAKPTVYKSLDVGLHLEMQLRNLVGQSINGVPVISNREYTGSINLREGEPAVIAGMVSRSEQRSMGGIPGLGLVPGLNQIMTSNNKQEDKDELLVVITPHVLSLPPSHNSVVWLRK